MKINIIAAMDFNRCIGRGNSLPWKMTNELQLFKKITIGKGNNAVLMGRKTWDSLYVKPLPNRYNIIITHNPYKYKDIKNTSAYDNILLPLILPNNFDTIWVIGGRSIYEAMLKYKIVDEMIITEVSEIFDGDVFFPKVPKSKWEKQFIATYDDFVTYRLKKVVN